MTSIQVQRSTTAPPSDLKEGKFDVQQAILEGRGVTPLSYVSAFSWKNSFISYKDAVKKYQPLQLAALKAGLADTIVEQCNGGLCPQGLWCVHRMRCTCSTRVDSTLTDQFGSKLCVECLNIF
jgi:hypothetical protein